MLKRNRKKQILAAVLSAAFCVSGYGISDAYTYSGVTQTTNNPIYDSSDLVVTNGSNITVNDVECKTRTLVSQGDIYIYKRHIEWVSQSGGHQVADFVLPMYITEAQIKELNYSSGTIVDKLGNIINYDCPGEITEWEIDENGCIHYNDKTYNHTNYSGFICEYDQLQEEGDLLQDLYSTVSYEKSTKTITTTDVLKVTNSSRLTAKNNITARTITSDGDIVAASNYSAPSGKSTITASTINATGALTASKDISASTGSLSANTIQATGGNIMASNTITARSKVKGKSLSVAKVNASSASVTGALIFSGNTVLSGGATANSKKISSVGTGTASTDLINLGQLNTAFSGSGTTYTAGSNIAINSTSNVISAVKNGAIKSGDTGIVTGATVFDITSGLESSLTLQNTRLTNLSSSIKSKDTSFGTISTSVSGLQSNVNSAVSSLNTKAQSHLRNDFRNISDEGKTRLSNLITSSIKNYKDSLNGVVSTTNGGSLIATFETKDIPVVDASGSGVGNRGTVTGGDIYTALETKADKDAVNNMLNEKVAISEFSSIKDSVSQNKNDIAGLKASKADVASFNTALEGKVDKSDFDTLHSQAMVNREDITSLISSKLNADGSDLDASAYSTKLANGILEKQNKGLVTGGMVYDALRFIADKDYVDAIGKGLNHTLQETAYSLNKDMNKMAAGAAALAGLHPQDYSEDSKVDFATGYGHYKDANAVAVGLFYHPNPVATISLSGTLGNGSPMVNAGLSFKVGYGKHVEKAVVNKADYEALQGQVEKLKEMVTDLAK